MSRKMGVAFGGMLMALAYLVAGATQASAAYPDRPIRIIVGFAAGGGNDLFARLIMQKFQENTGATTVIENRVGAGGRIAAGYVANSAADGYTVLVGATGQIAVAAAIYNNLNYDPKTLVPLNMIASFPLILVVPASNPAKNVKELVAWAKSHPNKANYGTSSPAFTIATELLKLKTGMPGVAIPYKSSNESNLCVASAQCLLTISDGPPAIPLIKGGKTRALAVTGAERSPELPDVPSMAEAGYPAVDMQLWSGFFVPSGTPPKVIAYLTKELGRALADARVREGLKKMAVRPGGPTGAEFKKRVLADIEKFAGVVKAAKLKFQ